jgi:hypothetical protein
VNFSGGLSAEAKEIKMWIEFNLPVFHRYHHRFADALWGNYEEPFHRALREVFITD